MGQRVGKMQSTEEFAPYMNLSANGVIALWDSFNLRSDSFGLTRTIFKEVCAPCCKYLSPKSRGQASPEVSKEDAEEMAEDLFAALDTDDNGLVDALEFLGAIAACSATSSEFKLRFIFDAYDFDGSGELSIDEMTLSMKGTIVGLCKIAGDEKVPEELHLEAVSAAAFAIADKDRDDLIDFTEFVGFMSSSPEAKSWMDYFDDLTVDTTQDPVAGHRFSRGAPYAAWSKTNMLGQGQKKKRLKKIQPGAWEETVSHIEPSDPPPIPELDGPPETEMDLEWVHGYGKQCSRVRYVSSKDQRELNKERERMRKRANFVTKTKRLEDEESADDAPPNEFVYTAASFSIVYNVNAKRQRYMKAVERRDWAT